MPDVLLPGQLTAVHQARAAVNEQLRAIGLDHLIDDAELVVSELVSNAVLHGKEPIGLVVLPVGDGVRLEVSDGSTAPPMPGLGLADGMTGRGLLVVEAIASKWGYERSNGGKVVWALLGAGQSTAEPELSADEILAQWVDEELDIEPTEPLYDVELRDVPTDLLVAAKMHVENLVRESTLAGASDESTVPKQLVDLLYTVTNRFSIARDEIKRQALAAASRGEMRTSVHLRLPADAGEAARDYLRGLNEVDAFSRAARLLTLETPPAHRLFREWYIGEIVEQLRAAETGRRDVEPKTFEIRLLEQVEKVTQAEHLAERTARLHSVAAALAQAGSAHEVARAVLDEVQPALGADAVVLLTVRPDGRLSFSAAVGYSDDVLRALDTEPVTAELPAAWVIRHGEPAWLESREELATRFPELRALEPSTAAMCVAPLGVGDRTIGALRFSFASPRPFDDEERGFVVTVAAQAAQALERMRLADEEQRATKQLSMLAQASAALAESLDYDITLQTVAELAVPDFADWVLVHVAGDRGIRPVAVAHVDPAKVDWARSLEVQYPINPTAPTGPANVLRTGVTEFYPEISEEMLVTSATDDSQLEIMRSIGLTSSIIAPMTARGRTLGAVTFILAGSGREYAEADIRLAEDLARRAALAVDNSLLYRQRDEVAAALQRSLLPPQLPVIPGLQLAAAYHPASEEVGGDFYDIWSVAPGTWAFAVGDVCGTGPEAAAFTAVVRATLRALLLTEQMPSAALERLNDAIVRGSIEGYAERFCTIVLGTIRARPGGVRVHLATGGHPPPLLRTPDGVSTVPVAGSLIGVFEEATIGSSTFSMDVGDLLLLYTDGVVEARTPNGGLLGEEGLLSIVRGAPVEPTSMTHAIEQELVDIGPAHDDFALLAIGVTPMNARSRQRQAGPAD